jgi:broad specificity phosphatase PhoE
MSIEYSIFMDESKSEGAPTGELPQRAEVKKITIEDLHPVVPEENGTVIVVMRNAKDDRSETAPDLGALKPEAAQATYQNALAFFEGIMNSATEAERSSLDFLIVASDTTLITPVIRSEHKRAVETADQVMRALKETMVKYSLPNEQLLNKSGRPTELQSGRMTDLEMMKKNSDFVAKLRENHTKDGVFQEFGAGGFWADFEIDSPELQKLRAEMGNVEGHGDAGDRVHGYVRVLAKALALRHERHPGRRTVAVAVGHYDSISPWLKRHVVKEDFPDFTQELPVEQGAGIVLKIEPNSNYADTTIQGNTYKVPLAV